MTARRSGWRAWRSSVSIASLRRRSGGDEALTFTNSNAMKRGLFTLATLCAARAGAQWVPQQSGTDAEFRGLVAVSPLVVWASGTRGRVARTTNGGKTWRVDSLAGADSLDFRDIHGVSATRAWAMSAGLAENGQAKIFHTVDGARWTTQFDTKQKGVFLDAISFWDDR